MKLLWLYRYFPLYDFDHHLHMTFAKFMASYPGIYLKAYGPDINKGYPLINLYPYHNQIKLKQIYKDYPFDLIIINTKSRCFDFYNPKTKEERGCWLPSDFHKWNKTPKVVIEEDYHYEVDDDWYQEMGIDLILQRHYSQSLRQNKIPMKFLPFSVDMGYFNSWSTEVIYKKEILQLPYIRKKNICFVGNNEDLAYKYRTNAINTLTKHKLGINFSGFKKINGEYLQVLREYVGYISCGSTYEICAAKNFEIMACGGVLFTNKFSGIDLLFPENSYCSYKNDGSDVLQKAIRVLTDHDYTIEILKNARQCIFQNHTHDVRVKQMLDTFRELL